MIQKIKITMLSLFAVFMFSAPLLTPGLASAAATNQTEINKCLQQGSNLTFDSTTGTCTPGATETGGTLTDRVATVLNILSIIVGAVAVVMVIVGGFRYTTSGGKEEGVKGAKNSILYALIGLIIVALAQVIVRFVLSKAV